MESPNQRLMKLNVDDSCVQDHGMVGFNGVTKYHSGMIRLSFVGPLPNCLAIEAELHALWRGVLEMEGLGVVRGILEEYFKVLLSWTSSSMCPWKFLNKEERILHSYLHKWSFGLLGS